MKRNTVLCFLLAAILVVATAQAQTPTPGEREKAEALKARQAERAARVSEMKLQVQSRIFGAQDPQSRLATEAQAQQRGAVGRGAPPDTANLIVSRNYTVSLGAWWTNKAMVERLGITDDQKAKIERSFENHRLDLAQKTTQLQKEESQLSGLLAADAIDRNAVLTQTDRVIVARGELERANSAMTLEMRESLTRAQWMQLPQPGLVRSINGVPVPAAAPRGADGGGGGAGGGARGRGRPRQRNLESGRFLHLKSEIRNVKLDWTCSTRTGSRI